MGCVYLVTNLINGKGYVGKTLYSLNYRKQQHERLAKGKGRWVIYRALRKYGFENFKWEILFESDNEKILNIEEIDHIKYLNTKSPNGYNMTIGGDGVSMGPLSEEHKRKVGEGLRREAKKRKIKRKFTPEHIKKLSDARKGVVSPRLGGVNSKEHRLLISIALKGRTLSQDVKDKISESAIKANLDPELRKKKSDALKGKPWTEARRKAYENKKKVKQCLL